MKFKARIEIIGVNPFVFVPAGILAAILAKAGKDKGPVPVKGTLNGSPYKQTLVKYAGHWRLYINTTMLKNSPKHVGETIELTIDTDSESRAFQPPLPFIQALAANPDAKAVFESLPPSRANEIVRYLARLKSPEALAGNVIRAIAFLQGKERFIGRDKP